MSFPNHSVSNALIRHSDSMSKVFILQPHNMRTRDLKNLNLLSQILLNLTIGTVAATIPKQPPSFDCTSSKCTPFESLL